jgi:Fanconi anemia group M protein
MEALAGRGINVVLETLDVGDYTISDRVSIERKSVGDLESSIIDGRLFDQVERLKGAYEKAILVIEGDPGEFKLHSNVILGTVMSLYIDHDIQSVFSNDPDETAEIIYRLAAHEQEEGRREPSAKKGRRAHSSADFQRGLIGNLPGIGPKLATALLKRFGSVRSIANATPDELMKVEKIGDKKAKAIHDTFNIDFSDDADEQLNILA